MKTEVFVALVAACAAIRMAAQSAAPVGAPQYTASGLVNSANSVSTSMAPNMIATLSGQNLSFNTAALRSSDIENDTLPTEIPLSGVHVLVGGLMANLYYVSPTKIMFLLPADIPPGTTTLQVVRDGYAGPQLSITLAAAAPAFFMMDSERVLAQRLDGSVITTINVAHPGDTVLLYATGLGQTVPPVDNGEVPLFAHPIASLSDFGILLDGSAVPASSILYAGTAPNLCGVYQIRLVLPETTGPDPQIRMSIGTASSPQNVRLIVRPPQ